MIFYLFLLLIVLPVVEIVVLVQIGIVTHWWVPILIVVVTGVVGAARGLESAGADAGGCALGEDAGRFDD